MVQGTAVTPNDYAAPRPGKSGSRPFDPPAFATGSIWPRSLFLGTLASSDAKIWPNSKMASTKSSGFDAAVARFRAFLKANNYSENIVWVMPEDILLTGKRFLYVRVPIPADNERRIRRMYDEGMTQAEAYSWVRSAE